MLVTKYIVDTPSGGFYSATKLCGIILNVKMHLPTSLARDVEAYQRKLCTAGKKLA